jgi:hypothetical protein
VVVRQLAEMKNNLLGVEGDQDCGGSSDICWFIRPMKYSIGISDIIAIALSNL